jgi:hypothetical protein
MPYIVTTKHPRPGLSNLGQEDRDRIIRSLESRRAVATLDEARNAAIGIAQELGHPNWGEVGYVDAWIRVQGGTIGPPPDGTVIKVEKANTIELACEISFGFEVGRGPNTDEGAAALLAAYNAAQAPERQEARLPGPLATRTRRVDAARNDTGGRPI